MIFDRDRLIDSEIREDFFPNIAITFEQNSRQTLVSVSGKSSHGRELNRVVFFSIVKKFHFAN
ncbi:hypothetical protein HGB47_09020 [Leptospira yasudae]|uniref:hypothetical protein n=1 Tax=Leptospira yasudae TaxID=2202201 RepID=UPI001C4F028B|nr:hypothetical protein [Leptospira yasudae]MBW0433756.1 hypothetical protein [Leptospira yasudae]